jgi:hypothetical protein
MFVLVSRDYRLMIHFNMMGTLTRAAKQADGVSVKLTEWLPVLSGSSLVDDSSSLILFPLFNSSLHSSAGTADAIPESMM